MSKLEANTPLSYNGTSTADNMDSNIEITYLGKNTDRIFTKYLDIQFYIAL
jgi:hypothetical protein